jgi:two-component system phosphate regulon sensor histidine kinase PhoR
MVTTARYSLLRRLTLAVVAVQVMGAAALIWIAAVGSMTARHDLAIRDVERLAPFVGDDLEALSGPALAERIDALAERAGMRISVLTPDGRALVDSHADAVALENQKRALPEVLGAMDGRPTSDVRYSGSLGSYKVFHAFALPDGMIVHLEADADGGGRGTRMLLFAGAGALLATALVLAYYIRTLRHSITRIGRALVGVAGERFDQRVGDIRGSDLDPIVDAYGEVSERLQEQILRLTDQRGELDAIVQSLDVGLLAIDKDQKVIRLNSAARRILSLDNSDPRGRLVQEVAPHSELLKFIAGSLDRVMSSEIRVRPESPVIVWASSTFLQDAQGRRVGLLILLRDITRLRRLESARSDFAANASHELRTPITNIRGYVETLMEGESLEGEQSHRFLEVIHRNATRLGNIVDDMLTLTRLEGAPDDADMGQGPTPVGVAIDAVRAQLADPIEVKGMRVESDSPRDLAVLVDPHLLEQALLNILANAVKYSEAGTTIKIAAQRIAFEGGEPAAEITIIDEGPGIAPEHQKRIFERFYRVDKARSREQGGTGLGLAIVKHIALVHRGTVSVESTVGRGSAFRLVLPALPLGSDSG